MENKGFRGPLGVVRGGECQEGTGQGWRGEGKTANRLRAKAFTAESSE